MDDGRILDLFFSRSQQAIEETESKYGRKLYHLAESILSNRMDAEECVSDALLGAWNSIPPARPEPLLPYLYKTVRNICLNRYRREVAEKRGGKGFDEAFEELETTLSGGESPEDALAAKELGILINSFVKGLLPRDRALFLGRYWFGEKYSDLAQRLDMSENACAVHTARLRKRLKEYLEKRGAI